MQALYDLLPVLAFFVAYKLAGIYVATGVLLAATALQVAFQWWRTRTVSRMALISAGLVLVFGGATLLIHDELFIMWKPTVLYLLFAAALLASQKFTATPILQRLLGEQIPADARTWRLANGAWAAFFVTMAAANYAFVHGFAAAAPGSPDRQWWESAWVTWKLASIGVVFVFALAQAVWLTRRVEAPADAP